MDLHKEWQAFQDKENNSKPLKSEEIMTAIYQDSKSVIAQLEKKLNASKALGGLLVGFTLLNGYASRDNWAELSLMIAFFIAGSIMTGLSYQMLQRVQADAKTDTTPLEWLRYNHQLLTDALSKIRITRNILFTILGLYFLVLKPMTWGGDFLETITSTKYLVITGISALIILPVAFYMEKRSTQRSLGVHADKLADNIKQLEEIG